MNIEQLQQQEKELRDLLSENLNKQIELNKAEFIKNNGFDIGDTVEWVDGKMTKKGVISDIEFAGTEPRRYKVTLFNSDGKLGKLETRIWIITNRSISKGLRNFINFI